LFVVLNKVFVVLNKMFVILEDLVLNKVFVVSSQRFVFFEQSVRSFNRFAVTGHRTNQRSFFLMRHFK